ncbi:hypothetical protein EKK58_05630 [Candidatus Dependentiae bacterium]|nr:MAG: hypothetical protein EKK58_05630 [Candidatus Dependentiae bacterium]
MQPEVEVQIFRKPNPKQPKESPSPMGFRRVPLPVGMVSTDDEARRIVRQAMATFDNVVPGDVTINLTPNGHFVAYLPFKEK